MRRTSRLTNTHQQRISANGEMLLRLSVTCLSIAQTLGDALAECEHANAILNNKINYEGLAKVTSNDRVGATTVALEARLRTLITFYFTCSEYLNNVWEQMSALDQELAQRIMVEFAVNNGGWLRSVMNRGEG